MVANSIQCRCHDSVPADSVERVVDTKTEMIRCQKVFLSPRPPPKSMLKDTWQVQREDSQAAVEQEDDRIRSIRRLVHQVKNHPNKDA